MSYSHSFSDEPYISQREEDELEDTIQEQQQKFLSEYAKDGFIVYGECESELTDVIQFAAGSDDVEEIGKRLKDIVAGYARRMAEAVTTESEEG